MMRDDEGGGESRFLAEAKGERRRRNAERSDCRDETSE
jgi:hypothetical protein